nr:MAG TPA: hypothetical protein [Caudoviricetes sp.]
MNILKPLKIHPIGYFDYSVLYISSLLYMLYSDVTLDVT